MGAVTSNGTAPAVVDDLFAQWCGRVGIDLDAPDGLERATEHFEHVARGMRATLARRGT
jgi:hypothetical protein